MLGLSVLVVEEEFLVAAEIEATLLAAGAAQVLVARDGDETVLNAKQIDLAIIEARLGDPSAIDMAARLGKAGLAIVVTSADRATTSLFTGAIPLEKPFDDAALLAACEAALRAVRPLVQV